MLVVVGGHTRNIGKTSVVAGLIRSLREFEWTAVKITQYGHGVCSAAGEDCGCATELDHPYALDQETDPASSTDTSRFLAAGAVRSYWLRTATGELGHAMPAFRELWAGSPNLIVESNSVLQFVRPDLFLAVMNPAIADFKKSARRYLDLADAILWTAAFDSSAWPQISRRLWKDKRHFLTPPPAYSNGELVTFVKGRNSLRTSCV